MNNKGDFQPSTSTRTGGVIARQLRKHQLKRVEFNWWKSTTDFGSSHRELNNDVMSFKQLCEQSGETHDNLILKEKGLQYRALMYVCIAISYLTIITIATVGGSITLWIFIAMLPICTMFIAMAVRMLFWSYQIRYGMHHQDASMPLFNQWVKNPDCWF